MLADEVRRINEAERIRTWDANEAAMLAEVADPSLLLALHLDLEPDRNLGSGLGHPQERRQAGAEPTGSSLDPEDPARQAAPVRIVEPSEHLRQRVEPRAQDATVQRWSRHDLSRATPTSRRLCREQED